MLTEGLEDTSSASQSQQSSLPPLYRAVYAPHMLHLTYPPSPGETVINDSIFLRRVMFNEVTCPDHTTRQWWNEDLNPSLSDSASKHYSAFPHAPCELPLRHEDNFFFKLHAAKS